MNENVQSAIDWFTGAPLRIALILIVALILQKTSGRTITRAINKIAEADLIPGPNRSIERQRERARTAGSVLRSTSNATIWLITSTMVLGQLGLDLGLKSILIEHGFNMEDDIPEGMQKVVNWKEIYEMVS